MSVILTKGDITTQINTEILERIRSGQGNSFLYIVSTQRTVDRLLRKFLDIAGGAYLEPQIYTLKTLSDELYRRFGSNKKIIAKSVQTILMQDIVDGMELGYFKPEPDLSVPQGTVIQLVEAINRLKTAGVTPDILEAELKETGESEAKKLNDMFRVYIKYEQELRENELVDEAGISREIAYLLSNNHKIFKKIFPEVELVVVSGYDVFSAYNFKIIDSIASVEDVDAYVALELNLSNKGLFGHLIENYQNFMDSGFQVVSGITEKVDQYRALFSHNLFSEDEVSEKRGLANKISLIKTKTREDEVETIAKLIKNAVTEVSATSATVERTALSVKKSEIRIGLTFYQLETYAPLIREIFPIYGIPFNMDTGYELANSPVVVSILSLLEAVEEDFSRRNVLRALKTPYFSFRHVKRAASSLEDSIDVGNLFSVSARLKITSGASEWDDKISERLEAIKLDEPDEAEDERIALTKAQEDIQYFIKLLEPIKTSLTPQEFRDNLITLLEILRLPQQILSVLSEDNEFEVEKDIRAYRKFIEVLESVIDFVQLRHDDNKKHSLAFYLNALRLAISQTRFYTRKKSEYGVQIVPITDMINPTVEPKDSLFDIVILGGLVDGEFPAVFYPDLFLSEKRSKTEHERLLEDRFLFYQTVTIPEKYLYLTYPKFEDDGTELVRSPFVDEILRIAEVEETPPSELDKVVYNEERLLKIYGEHLWHGYKPDGFSLSPELSDKLKAVEHNIRVKKSRTEKKPELPEYNGVIFDSIKNSSQEKISRLKDREYSISQLETYGKCPFRYFAKRILQLNELEEIEEGLSYLEHGNLLHKIMYEFYSNREGQKPLNECSDKEFEEAANQLIEVAEAEIDQINLTGLFWEVQVERIVGEPGKRKGILQTFLEEIDRKSKTKAVPMYFEVPFGSSVMPRFRRDKKLDLGEEIQIGDVKMRGIIDRVEIGDEFFVVADYKTGSTVPKIDDIIEGRSVQLPVYLKALEQFWEQQGQNLKGTAGVYYQLREKCKAKLGLGDAEYNYIAFKAGKTNGQIVPGKKVDLSLDEIVARSSNYLSDYVEAISHGEFPLTPHAPDEVCRYCPYKRICRISPTGVR